jgi:hypothetical protein
LYEFTGRSGFFFDCFFQKTLPTIKAATTREGLFDQLVALLKGPALTQLDADIEGYIARLVERNEEEISKALISRLYYFQIMHNGCATFTHSEDDAINAGFAFLVDDSGNLVSCIALLPIILSRNIEYCE